MTDNRTRSPRFLPVIPDAVPEPEREPGPPPVFERIAVVGLGLIGGSIAMAARKAWPTALVIGVDRAEVLETAMARHAVDVASPDPMIVAGADLVVLATPIGETIRLVPELPSWLPGEAVVTDVGSTKREIVEAAMSLPERLPFVGGDPLAGMPRGGFGRAREDLFAGRPWLLVGDEERADPASPLAKLIGFVSALEAAPVVVPSAAAHDEIAAWIAHLPQLASTVLMAEVGKSAGEWLSLAGRGLADATRLASAPAGPWRDVCATNADLIAASLDRLIGRLQELRAGLRSAETIERLFAEANGWRERLHLRA